MKSIVNNQSRLANVGSRPAVGVFPPDVNGRLPLCTRYLSIQFNVLKMQIRDEQGRAVINLPWALGTTSDGDHEVLGVWRSRGTDSHCSESITSELVARGLKSVEVVVDRSGEGIATAILLAYPLVRALESLHGAPQALWPVGPLSHRAQRVVSQALRTAHLLQCQTTAVLDRMAPFPSADAAAALAEGSLVRAERRLRDKTAPVTPRERQRTGPLHKRA